MASKTVVRPLWLEGCKPTFGGFSAGVLNVEWIPVNPVASMERVAQVKSRERVLCDKELAQVWSACDGMFGLATRLLILTGCRREEIGQLKWSEIDGDTIVLEGDRTKNGEAHIIPLSTAARVSWTAYRELLAAITCSP